MNAPVRYQFRGKTFAEITTDVEGAIRRGALRPRDQLPPVRALADRLGVSPGTVAAAYRDLRLRGMTVGDGRRGTRVAERPAVRVPRPGLDAHTALPAGVRDLASGGPDPSLLPDLRPYLSALADAPAGPIGRSYGGASGVPELVDQARRQFAADHVPDGNVAVVGGALDGIERILQAHLRPGDSVVVEDPGYPAVHDLVGALGLSAMPVPVDDQGLDADAFVQALARGARAAIVTPRAHNPTGAVLSDARAGQLRAVLHDYPDALVVEDDHAAEVAGAPYATLADGRRNRWAVVRSVSKALGPDLRLALVAADADTEARVEGRRQLGTGWVSHLLQQLVLALWSDQAVVAQLDLVGAAYHDRRRALVAALADHGIDSCGDSGLNVWVPVADESAVVTRMLSAGWSVAPGARYRRRTAPAVRVTVATLSTDQAVVVAAALAQSIALSPGDRLLS
jgi:DNA-binding transcriptional MocR family regulator